MEKGYMQFVEHFREMILTFTEYTEEEVYLKRENDSIEDDRLFVECARKGGIRQVCALHTKELYEGFCQGTSMEELLRTAMEGVAFVKKDYMFQKVLDMDEYEAVKDSLFIRLLNLEKNKEDLKDAVYRTLGDIAMVVYLKIGDMDGCLTSLKIRKSLLRKWELEDKFIFEKALFNTYRMSPPRIFLWEKLLFDLEYSGEAFMSQEGEEGIKQNDMGTCLSTESRVNGAVAIFLPGVAQRIAHLLGSDFFIVFTSVHEAMLHSDQVVKAEELKKILADTIREATPEEDFLTYKIYHYESADGSFSCVF